MNIFIFLISITKKIVLYVFAIPLLVLLVGCTSHSPKIEADRGLPVYGYIEDVYVESDDLKLPAKLDSGADTSSMNALDLTELERDGKEWVRFHIIHPQTEEQVVFEKRVVRWSTIKRHHAESVRRPVVLMKVKIGNNDFIRSEFSLTDRSTFEYQVLLGRNYLNGIALIDVSKKYQAKKQW